MLSIKVPFLFENRVGKVICGHRLCAINRSKKSQYIIFSCIFSRFMLVSPAKIMIAFRFVFLYILEQELILQ